MRWNPLSRDAGAFETFAADLDAYVQSSIDAGSLPRFWLPYPAALTLVEVLGHRYATNKAATAELQRMGQRCLAIADEATYRGQQAIAVATDVLIRHVATGQAPIKDHHLGALLAWVEPVAGADPAVEANRRAFDPAAAMLPRQEDLRDRGPPPRGQGTRAGGGGGEGADRVAARCRGDGRVDPTCRQRPGVLQGLGLPAAPTLPALVERSRRRLSFYLAALRSRPRRAPALSRVLDEHEHAEDLARDAALRGDALALERAHRTGRAVLATVVRVAQPSRGRRPCSIVLETDQPVLRVRAGTSLSRLGGGIGGRVVDVDDDGGVARITLALTTGFRSVPAVGARVDLVDSGPFNPGRLLRSAYQRLSASPPPLLAGGAVATPRSIAVVDLAAAAEELIR